VAQVAVSQRTRAAAAPAAQAVELVATAAATRATGAARSTATATAAARVMAMEVETGVVMEVVALMRGMRVMAVAAAHGPELAQLSKTSLARIFSLLARVGGKRIVEGRAVAPAGVRAKESARVAGKTVERTVHGFDISI